jgi:hypothetical protein
MAGSKTGKPTAKEIDGQKVYSFQKSPRDGYHYGRSGKVIVFGPYRDPVAKALAAGAAKKGWLGDTRSAKLLKGLEEPVAVAVVKPAKLVLFLFMARGAAMKEEMARVKEEKAKIKKEAPKDPDQKKPSGDKKEKGPKGPADKKPSGDEKKGVTVRVETVTDKENAKMKKELDKVVGREVPLVMSLSRQEGRVTFEAKLGGLKAVVARLTDFVVEQMYRTEAQRRKAMEERSRKKAKGKEAPPKKDGGK